MKSLIFVLATIFSIEAVEAQPPPFEVQINIVCNTTDIVIETIEKKYKERAVFVAPSKNENGENLYHSLWVNAETQTWTFIVVNQPRNAACVIASGQNFSSKGIGGI